MPFDPTIGLGHLLTLAGTVAAVIGGWYTMRSRLDYMVRCIAEHDKAIEKISAMLGAHERELAELSARARRRRPSEGER